MGLKVKRWVAQGKYFETLLAVGFTNNPTLGTVAICINACGELVEYSIGVLQAVVDNSAAGKTAVSYSSVF